MTSARSVVEVLDEHVTLQLECIDRMYLDVYVPVLQFEQGVACFFVTTAALTSPLRLDAHDTKVRRVQRKLRET